MSWCVSCFSHFFSVQQLTMNLQVGGVRFKAFSKKTLEQGKDDATKGVLAHQWCRAQALNLSAKEKILFKTVLTEKCAGTESMPWIDKVLLTKYVQLKGNVMQLIRRQDQALFESNR